MNHFDQATIEKIANTREVEVTTYGRSSGKPHAVTIWILDNGSNVYILSGQGLKRDWPQNLLANPHGVLTVEGEDIPFQARHVTDPAEARSSAALLKEKYGMDREASPEGGPLARHEQAMFELTPEPNA